MMNQQISSNDLKPESGNRQSTIHWPSALQLCFSLISITILWGFSITLGILTIGGDFYPEASGLAGGDITLFLMSSGIFFAGLLLLPSAGYAFFRLVNKPFPFILRLPRSIWLLSSVFLLLFIGYIVSNKSNLLWAALPPIHILTFGVSALWVVSLGTRSISVGSKQISWGIFSLGLVIAPLFSMITELIAITIVGAVGIGFLARAPDFAEILNQVTETLLANPNLPLDFIIESFEPYLLHPITLGVGFIIVAVLVPVIEEFFKPIGVWLLVKKNPSPSQGFAAGVISGTGFGLFENFLLSASTGSDWSLIALARIGTTFIHALTAGLTGWALATAWLERRYIRLGFTYLLAVVIHSLWNGFAVLEVIQELLPEGTAYPGVLINIGTYSPIGLFIMLLGCFSLLLGFNSILRRAIMSPGNIE